MSGSQASVTLLVDIQDQATADLDKIGRGLQDLEKNVPRAKGIGACAQTHTQTAL